MAYETTKAKTSLVQCDEHHIFLEHNLQWLQIMSLLEEDGVFWFTLILARWMCLTIYCMRILAMGRNGTEQFCPIISWNRACVLAWVAANTTLCVWIALAAGCTVNVSTDNTVMVIRSTSPHPACYLSFVFPVDTGMHAKLGLMVAYPLLGMYLLITYTYKHMCLLTRVYAGRVNIVMRSYSASAVCWFHGTDFWFL